MDESYKHNQETWNKESAESGRWSIPVSKEEIDKARSGEWSIILTPTRGVPRNWFPDNLKGLNVLLVAGGGGQQGPIIAATGANVTVLDASSEQLKKDRETCERNNLPITTLIGDMQNMHQLKDESFDLIINPCSNCFIPDIDALWKECYRVLRPGGSLMSGHLNPTFFAADPDKIDKTGEIVFVNKIPFKDISSESNHWEYGHSLESLIGGQLKQGFLMKDFYEDEWSEENYDRFMKLNFATLSVKF